MGVTILAASGDDGAPGSSSCGYDLSFPASSPYVTAVGATMGIESVGAEVVCSTATGSVITSGGGFSNVFSTPAYQRHAVNNYVNRYTSGAASGE